MPILHRILALASIAFLGAASALAGPEPGKREVTRIIVGDGEEFRAAVAAEGAEWMSHFRRGFLGVQLTPMTPELREHFGAPKDRGILVAGVSDDSPAARAGIRTGDILTEIAGRKIESHADVMVAMGDKEDGAQVSVTAIRNRAPLALTATIEQRDRRIVALNRLPEGARVFEQSAPEELRRFFAGDEWRERVFRLQDCQESQQRLREVEERLRQLEKRLE